MLDADDGPRRRLASRLELLATIIPSELEFNSRLNDASG